MEQPILEYFLSLKYPISIYPEEEGGYTALIPDLPGCMTHSKTLEEVMINIEEASEFG
jgi:antitoxin HicB